uniref:Uncharacterized protein n=1 Tax=Leersia perrieri TaxID=77586 RepID=A0A0D9V2U9_9ORYZ
MATTRTPALPPLLWPEKGTTRTTTATTASSYPHADRGGQTTSCEAGSRCFASSAMPQIELMWGNVLMAVPVDVRRRRQIGSRRIRSGRRCPDFFIFLVVAVAVDEGTILIGTAHQHSLLADLAVLKTEDKVIIQNAFDEEGEMALPMLTTMCMGGDTDESDHEDADIEDDMGVATKELSSFASLEDGSGGGGTIYHAVWIICCPFIFFKMI